MVAMKHVCAGGVRGGGEGKRREGKGDPADPAPTPRPRGERDTSGMAEDGRYGRGGVWAGGVWAVGRGRGVAASGARTDGVRWRFGRIWLTRKAQMGGVRVPARMPAQGR